MACVYEEGMFGVRPLSARPPPPTAPPRVPERRPLSARSVQRQQRAQYHEHQKSAAPSAPTAVLLRAKAAVPEGSSAPHRRVFHPTLTRPMQQQSLAKALLARDAEAARRADHRWLVWLEREERRMHAAMMRARHAVDEARARAAAERERSMSPHLKRAAAKLGALDDLLAGAAAVPDETDTGWAGACGLRRAAVLVNAKKKLFSLLSDLKLEDPEAPQAHRCHAMPSILG